MNEANSKKTEEPEEAVKANIEGGLSVDIRWMFSISFLAMLAYYVYIGEYAVGILGLLASAFGSALPPFCVGMIFRFWRREAGWAALLLVLYIGISGMLEYT